MIVSAALFSASLAFAQPPAPSLHTAAARGDMPSLSRALEANTGIDARDALGQTALLLAVEGGHTAAARALMERGASVNAQAANRDTPWLLAGALGRTAILDSMLAQAPDLSIRNRFGGSALIPACERAHVETVELLTTRSKIDVNLVNYPGWTCLLEIVVLGNGGPRHIEAARLVLAAGANPNIADREGVSPLAHARRRGQGEIAALIAAAGGR